MVLSFPGDWSRQVLRAYRSKPAWFPGVVWRVHSRRFKKGIIVTNHARERMLERDIDESVLLDLIETGELRLADEQHLFIFRSIPARRDNLVCAALVDEDALVVKTVMVNWTLRDKP
jgi:hypothetical protein